MSASSSGSKAKSKNQNSYQFNQDIPAFQASALNKLYGEARNLFGSSNKAINQQVPGATDYMNQVSGATLPALQDTLKGGVYQNLGAGTQLMDSLTQSLQSPTNTQNVYSSIMGGEGNNYADAMKASYTGDANRAMDNMFKTLDARATGSGMSGGSRHGIAQAQGAYDINSNLQKNLADVGYNTFDKDLTNKLNIAQQADSNTLSRQSMLKDILGAEQGTVNAGVNMSPTVQNVGMGQFAPTMMPWEALANYAATIGAPTVLSSGQGQGSGSSKAMGNSTSAGLT